MDRECQLQRQDVKMELPITKPVESLFLDLEHSAAQVGGRVFYCKLCSLESTRARTHTLLSLEEGVKHLQNHWRPPKQKRGPPIRKNKVPPELYYRKQAVNVEEDITLLAKLYLGFKVQERKPYRCGLCGEGFATTSDRYHHVGEEHVEATAPLLCCGASFQNREKYIQHMFFKHCELRRPAEKESFFVCDLCFVAFYNRTDLEWHFYRHNQHVANPIGEEDDGHFSSRSQFFRCSLCSDQCVLSRRKPPVLYTLSESFNHLAWHWLYQLPPEIRQNPVLVFEDDADVIHRLYMEAVGIREWRCGLCPLQLNKEHVLNYHSEARRAFRCEGVTCKNTLQFAKLEDFVGHIFMRHTRVLKLEERFLCLICDGKFENRNQMKWHCYIHNVARQVAS
ncbi:PREDICTED: zinc finger protein 271-like [Branchiostoma belcheri]|uniref:Zinc finger protein 271-like n=1 Tax=Branchiostoma belcheri TaxID=7741 RepID=A0A6P4YNR8_BRABE|nr:PREDICTED: zinc finger protein 271-like [Branchiostoma belcheri]XP_019623319.1 PREDICTED: zinc finger protein 271-like [Branchiostoma belcheri]